MEFIFPDPPKIKKKPVFVLFNTYMYRNGKKYAEWTHTDSKGIQHFKVIRSV